MHQHLHCDTVPRSFQRMKEKRNPKSSNKYYIDAADQRLPPPVLYVSDFERHAQRKNRVIQASYDDELLKIGIDRRVSNKFLTSDVRRFCHRTSVSKKLGPGGSTSFERRSSPENDKCFDNTQHNSDSNDKTQKTIVMSRKRSPRTNTRVTLKEAWGSKETNTSSQNIRETVFLTTMQETNADNNSRILPQSAKLRRNPPDKPEGNLRRPKSTSPASRHVRFWDEVEDPMENEKANKSGIQWGNLTISGKSKQLYHVSISGCREKSLKPLKAHDVSAMQRCSDQSKKVNSSKLSECSLPHGKLLDIQFSSFLHFDKLQASNQLRRELRNNAENRKSAYRRRKLSEILRLEKRSYNESLSKMSSRLKDEKLLNFCRESSRGLDSVFNYNL